MKNFPIYKKPITSLLCNRLLSLLEQEEINIHLLTNWEFDRNDLRSDYCMIDYIDGNILELSIEGYKISENIFLEICNQTYIVLLALTSSSIKAIPQQINQLIKMRNLDLSDNEISEVPLSMRKMYKLIDVNLSYNELREIPYHLLERVSPTTIDISYNNITLREKIYSYNEAFVLDGNPTIENVSQKYLDIIDRGESESIDFKREVDLSTKNKKAEFIKDIITLANSTENSSFLVIGIDDDKKIIGSTPLKEEQIQQLCYTYINPSIRLTLKEIFASDKLVIFIEIFPDGKPFSIVRDIDFLKKGDAFIRYGTTTQKASPQDIIKMHEWSKPNGVRLNKNEW